MELVKVQSGDRMTWGGIGPRLACITLPYVILATIVMQRDPEFLRLTFLDTTYAPLIGYFILGIGFVFWIASALVFLRDFKKGDLIVRGPYALCRNPIYASFIVFVLPALVLIVQSGMILTMDLVLYMNFKLSIHGERVVLQRTFGNTYTMYSNSVNELFPFPRFKRSVQ
jgi:protein-S-isoprenylcysteine O-methyltransferase Ste14